MSETMDFGAALKALKAGQKVARLGWNRAGMWLEFQRPDAHSKMTQPYIFINPDSDCRVPWVASQADLREEDWFLV